MKYILLLILTFASLQLSAQEPSTFIPNVSDVLGEIKELDKLSRSMPINNGWHHEIGHQMQVGAKTWDAMTKHVLITNFNNADYTYVLADHGNKCGCTGKLFVYRWVKENTWEKIGLLTFQDNYIRHSAKVSTPYVIGKVENGILELED